MAEPTPTPQPLPDFEEREEQDALYPDEEPEIQNDDLPPRRAAAPSRRKAPRIPQPVRRFEDD